jgi:hypothetical protein
LTFPLFWGESCGKELHLEFTMGVENLLPITVLDYFSAVRYCGGANHELEDVLQCVHWLPVDRNRADSVAAFCGGAT